jgi:hypothetical protein
LRTGGSCWKGDALRRPFPECYFWRKGATTSRASDINGGDGLVVGLDDYILIADLAQDAGER